MALRLVLFLLLGAVVNVAVAWGCAIYPYGWFESDNDLEPDGMFRRSGGNWTVIHFEPGRVALDQDGPGWLATRLIFPEWVQKAEFDAMLPHWSAFRDGDPTVTKVTPPETLSRYCEIGTGWPMYAFRGSVGYVYWGRDFVDGIIIVPDLHDYEQTQIPYRVIPLGFAINTFLYAAILWLLFAAPGRVRRWRRIRRGLCAKCAYPVGASDVCTECGCAIASARRPARK